MEFQSPSLRGSGRFSSLCGDWPFNTRFQSPSLRGSGRFFRRAPCRRCAAHVSIPFIAGQWSLRLSSPDAVWIRFLVSIPFIAGQWSLRSDGAVVGGVRPSGFNPLHCGAVVASCSPCCARSSASRFNPLHCGAVVASPHGGWARRKEMEVSIPFIAGQWSLLTSPDNDWVRFLEVFQSPSLRGSGRFYVRPSRKVDLRRVFQSPSLRGSGRF